MAKRILKAHDVESLENTSLASALGLLGARPDIQSWSQGGNCSDKCCSFGCSGNCCNQHFLGQ